MRDRPLRYLHRSGLVFSDWWISRHYKTRHVMSYFHKPFGDVGTDAASDTCYENSHVLTNPQMCFAFLLRDALKE